MRSSSLTPTVSTPSARTTRTWISERVQHTCLGLHLARMEAQIAFAALLDRFPRVELREADPQWGHTLLLRGLRRLNVVLHKN